MPRLIEIPATSPLPHRLRLRQGDVVRLGATGARPPDGGAVEVLGPLHPGAPTPDGDVVDAVGTPATVLVIARHPGTAALDLVRGGLGGPAPATPTSVEVVVEEGPPPPS